MSTEPLHSSKLPTRLYVSCGTRGELTELFLILRTLHRIERHWNSPQARSDTVGKTEVENVAFHSNSGLRNKAVMQGDGPAQNPHD